MSYTDLEKRRKITYLTERAGPAYDAFFEKCNSPNNSDNSYGDFMVIRHYINGSKTFTVLEMLIGGIREIGDYDTYTEAHKIAKICFKYTHQHSLVPQQPMKGATHMHQTQEHKHMQRVQLLERREAKLDDNSIQPRPKNQEKHKVMAGKRRRRRRRRRGKRRAKHQQPEPSAPPLNTTGVTHELDL